MKTAIPLVLALVVARCAAAAPDATAIPGGAELGKQVPEFTAQAATVSGDTVQTAQFDSHTTQRATAYIFVGTTCPATNAYADRFKQLEEHYGPKGVDFVYIYPNRNDTSDAKLAFQKEKKFSGRLIDDQGARLARLFKAQRTSELFLTDKQGIVVYHGAVDDSRDPNGVKQHYLADALDALLAAKPITVASSQVFA
jgi:thiol-disulfide isomerase/thioredoxin